VVAVRRKHSPGCGVICCKKIPALRHACSVELSRTVIGNLQVVNPDQFSDLLDESMVAVTGPCSRDGTTTDVSIPAGAITITDLIAGEEDLSCWGP